MDEHLIAATRRIDGLTEGEPETVKLEGDAATKNASAGPALLHPFVEQKAEASNVYTSQGVTEVKPEEVGHECLIAASSEQIDLAEPLSEKNQDLLAPAEQSTAAPQENGRRVRRKTQRWISPSLQTSS